ncbi:MAG: hypothetical protein JXA20_11560 [Spirochaetes bacterium]|nr:hypothetical protein [Spirochaetota bacterium]
MGYWTEVKDVVLKGIDLAAQNIREGASTAVEKGKEGLTYVQLKKDLMVSQRKLHSLLADLGDRTCDLYRDQKDIYADDSVKELMGKINAAEEECKKIETEMKSLGGKKEAAQ